MRVPADWHDAAPTGSVLIVDDSPDARLIARIVLEGAGFDTMEAIGGAEALEALSSGPGVDLVLLDLDMPGMDGPSVLQQLLDDEARGDLPIVVVTSQPDLLGQGRIPASDRPAVVSKPYHPDKLIDVVGDQLSRSTGSLIG